MAKLVTFDMFLFNLNFKWFVLKRKGTPSTMRWGACSWIVIWLFLLTFHYIKLFLSFKLSYGVPSDKSDPSVVVESVKSWLAVDSGRDWRKRWWRESPFREVVVSSGNLGCVRQDERRLWKAQRGLTLLKVQTPFMNLVRYYKCTMILSKSYSSGSSQRNSSFPETHSSYIWEYY